MIEAVPAELQGSWAAALVQQPRRPRNSREAAEEARTAERTRDAGRPSHGAPGQCPELSLYQFVLLESVREALNGGPLDGDRLSALLWLFDPRPRSDFRLCCSLAGVEDAEVFRSAMLRKITDPLVLSFASNARRCFATLLLASFTEVAKVADGSVKR